MKMYPRLKERWIVALKSGNFIPSKLKSDCLKYEYNNTVHHDALGVLFELSETPDRRSNEGHWSCEDIRLEDGSWLRESIAIIDSVDYDTMLPDGFMGLSRDAQVKIRDLQGFEEPDKSGSYNDVIDWIEKNL